VAEQLALEQRVHHRGTVTYRQFLLAHKADLMNRARYQFFARARRSRKQHVCVMPGHFAREVEHLQHCWALSHNSVEL
jgi:hypothetical protein